LPKLKIIVLVKYLETGRRLLTLLLHLHKLAPGSASLLQTSRKTLFHTPGSLRWRDLLSQLPETAGILLFNYTAL